MKVRPRSEWHEDDGTVLWWIGDEWETHEEPYVGDLRDITPVPDEYRWWSPMPDFGPSASQAGETA